MRFKKPSEQPQRTRRTIQPSQQSAVFSYHANRSVRTAPTGRNVQAPAQLRQGPRFPWMTYAPHVLGLIVVMIVLLLSLRLDNSARIVVVGDAQKHIFLREQSVYEAAAARAFASPANSNKLTVNTEAVVTSLTKQFPELTTISVSLPFVGNKPTVYIQPATPALILATEQHGVHVLDSSGRALIIANQVTNLDKLKLPVVNDQSGLAITPGKVALPRTSVAFIDMIARQLQAKGLKPTSLILPAGTSELHVRLDGVGYLVKYNVRGNAREQVGAYLALKDYLANERKTPKEYVDVRVAGRAYYKYPLPLLPGVRFLFYNLLY